MHFFLVVVLLFCAPRRAAGAAALPRRGAAALPKPSRCAPRCDVTKCSSPPSCPGGLYVPDRCNCCLVCVRAEGDPCGAKNDPPCGQGLECRVPSGPPLVVKRPASKRSCRCKTAHRVCGSDGKTHGNVCKLRAAGRKAIQKGLPGVTRVSKGPCLPPDTGRSSSSAGRSSSSAGSAPLWPSALWYCCDYMAVEEPSLIILLLCICTIRCNESNSDTDTLFV